MGDARAGPRAIDHHGVYLALVEDVELVIFDVESFHDPHGMFSQGGEKPVTQWPMNLYDVDIERSNVLNDVVVTVLSKDATAKQ
jgi:hypothetical protein